MYKYLYYAYVASQAEKEENWHMAYRFWCLARQFARNDWDNRWAELRAMDINETHQLGE